MKFIEIDVLNRFGNEMECQTYHLNLHYLVLVYKVDLKFQLILHDGTKFEIAAESYYRLLRELGIETI